MARDFKRIDRIAEQIRKELALILQRDLKDPRQGMMTVSSVKVSKDLSYADVYYTVLNLDEADGSRAEELAQDVLDSARGYLRSELGRRIQLRVMPQLRFHYDRVIAQAQHLDGLIREARASDARRQKSSGLSSAESGEAPEYEESPEPAARSVKSGKDSQTGADSVES